MPPKYQIPQTLPSPANQLPDTNPDDMMHPDKAMASLAFSTHLLNQLLGHQASQPSGQPTPQSSPDAPSQEIAEPIETPETPTQTQPDTSEIDQKFTDLQASHEKEILMLKHELEVQGIKQGNDKKVSDLEKKHQQEIDDLKNTVKSIISG